MDYIAEMIGFMGLLIIAAIVITGGKITRAIEELTEAIRNKKE